MKVYETFFLIDTFDSFWLMYGESVCSHSLFGASSLISHVSKDIQ